MNSYMVRCMSEQHCSANHFDAQHSTRSFAQLCLPRALSLSLSICVFLPRRDSLSAFVHLKLSLSFFASHPFSLCVSIQNSFSIRINRVCFVVRIRCTIQFIISKCKFWIFCRICQREHIEYCLWFDVTCFQVFLHSSDRFHHFHLWRWYLCVLFIFTQPSFKTL